MSGDIDGNGIVDIDDIIAATRIYFGIPTNPPLNPNVLDLDGDGQVDINDIITLTRIYFGIGTNNSS